MRLLFIFLTCLMVFAGCAATDAQSSATMTNSVFIEPVSNEDKVIFVSVSNTSGEEVNLKPKIINKLKNIGYTVVDNPNHAVFILQANVLYCNIQREDNVTDGAIIGGAIGAGIGGYNSGATGAVLSGLAGATLGALAASATEDTVLEMQVDINIGQTNRYGQYIQKRTTLIADSIKHDLQFNEVIGVLEDKIASKVSGIFME